MMDLISCYSQYSVQISESASCSSYTPTSSCIVPPSSTPSTQTTVTSLYKTTLSSGQHFLISVTWHRTPNSQFLHINSDSTTLFRLNTHSGLFRKKKGAKFPNTHNSKFEIYYDLSSVQYSAGAEPVEGYYIAIVINSELGLVIGDLIEEPILKKIKTQKGVGRFRLVCKKEYFSGGSLYATKVRFSDAGNWHDVAIRCTGESEGLKYPVLQVMIDKRVVIRVKRLQWNFRGNQTIFLDGLLVDFMWDVHDWFFSSGSGSDSDTGSGLGSGLGLNLGSGFGSGRGVFMFRTRSGLDSRLWLEEKIVKSDDDDDDQKKGFSFLIYATKS